VQAPTAASNPSSSSSSSTLSSVQNLSPVTSNHDAAIEETPVAKPLSVVTTPVSPPPSPPAGQPANASIKPTAPLPSSRDETPRPTTEVTKDTSPMPSNTGTARSGSLASLLHSGNRDVTDSDAKKDMHGTPPSPDSLPQVGHSRNPSMADSSTTAKESPMKDSRDEEEEEDSMDIDHPPSIDVAAARNPAETTTSLPIPTHHPARHLASRSPQPQQPPHSLSLAGGLAPSQPRPQLSPSATSVAHPPHPHTSHVATQIQRHHHSTNHASSRSQSDRHPQPLPYPHPHVSASTPAHATQTPTTESPGARPFRAGSAEERDRQIGILSRERDDLMRNVERLHQQVQELQRREDEYRAIEQWCAAVSNWWRDGQQLLGDAPTNGHSHSNPSVLAGRQNGMLLSNAASRDYERPLERDRTLSVVSPYSVCYFCYSYILIVLTLRSARQSWSIKLRIFSWPRIPALCFSISPSTQSCRHVHPKECHTGGASYPLRLPSSYS